MKEVFSVELMRNSDAATIKGGVPGAELMMRAAKGIYEAVKKEHGWKCPVLIVCGSGNNAGDGYALALLLKEAGVKCKLLLTSERFSEDGRFYFDKCMEEGIEWRKHACSKSCKESDALQSTDVDSKMMHPINSFLQGYDADQDYIIVDCLYGTGFHGEVKEPIAGLIADINKARENGAYVVSVDINSGLNGNNGLCGHVVISDLTVSVGSFQPGHFLNSAKDVMKKKVNCPIGIEAIDKPYMLWEAADTAKYFPERLNMSNKGTYGYIALIGGSARYSGAIRLAALSQDAIRIPDESIRECYSLGEDSLKCSDIVQQQVSEMELAGIANAAMRSGAGVATIAVPDEIKDIVAANVLESTVFPLSSENGQIKFVEEEVAELIKNRKAVAVGMGIGTGGEIEKLITYLLENYGELGENNKTSIAPTETNKSGAGSAVISKRIEARKSLIIDADGLTVLSKLDKDLIRKCCTSGNVNVVLTPHLKEFSRLTGRSIDEIRQSPIELAREYAADTGCIVLLKGPTTIVTDGDDVILVDRGCAGMATAGSGDVLSGIVAAVCGAASNVGGGILGAVASAAWINGRAGELAQDECGAVSMIASDTVRFIPKAIKMLE